MEEIKEIKSIKKTPPYFLAAALVVLAIGVIAYLLYSNKVSLKNVIPIATPTIEVSPVLTIKTKAYTLQNEKGIQVYLTDKGGNTAVSALQLEFTLPENINANNLEVKINPALLDQGWKFPIARIESDSAGGTIKISGARFGNSPYEIMGNLLIATITNGGSQDISLSVNTGNTLIYASDAITKIPFDTAQE